MPIAKTYPLPSLLEACRQYVTKTRRQLFFEYALIKDVNDTSSHLSALIKLINSHPLYFLNLIPLNAVSGGMAPSPASTLNLWQQKLTQTHVPFSFRASLGQDISSACGQLVID